MLLFKKRIGPRKPYRNSFTVIAKEDILYIFFAGNANNCSSAVPDCPRKCTVYGSNLIVFPELFRIVSHQVNYQLV